MKNTTNYGFKLPEQNDFYDIEHMNDNFEAVDGVLKALENGNANTLNGLTAEEVGASGARNLLPYPFYWTTRTQAGVTYTDNGDGSITANGTATTTDAMILRHRLDTDTASPIFTAGTYTISCNNISTAKGTYLLVGYNSEDNAFVTASKFTDGDSATFELPRDSKLYVGLYVTAGTKVENLTFKPMLVCGKVAHDYVPYSFGGAEKAKDADKWNGWKIFTSRGAILSTATDSTPIADIVKAMPDYSRLVCNVYAGSADVYPQANGILKIDKTLVGGYAHLSFKGYGNKKEWVGIAQHTTSGTVTWGGWGLSSDGGDADTVDGYHASDFVRSVSPTFASGETILDWALNPNGNYTKFIVSGTYPSDVPVQTEGFCELSIDSSTHRRLVKFIPYQVTIPTYVRSIFQKSWYAAKWVSEKDMFLSLDGSVPMSGDLYIKKSAYPSEVRVINYNGEAFFRNFVDDNNYKEVTLAADGSLMHRVKTNGTTKTNTVLHTGNSAKVLVQNTPLTAEGSVRVW